MLAYVTFVIAVVALCAGTALEGGLAYAKLSVKRTADTIAQSAIAQARSAMRDELAQQIAAGMALVAPPPLARSSACSDSARCTFFVEAVFSLDGDVAAGPNATANTTAAGMQGNPRIAEDRLAVTIAATVTGPDATVLARRTEIVGVRTMKAPPYAMIDGALDAAASRDAGSAADAAGCDGTNGASCGRSGGAAADTRIRAVERCDDGGSGACAAAGQSYRTADNFSDRNWYNPTAAGAQWSR